MGEQCGLEEEQHWIPCLCPVKIGGLKNIGLAVGTFLSSGESIVFGTFLVRDK